MNEIDPQNPGWWDADEPLPMEVCDAIRVADREDGTAEQVARLEARLAPLLQTPPGIETSSPKVGAASGSLGTLKLVTTAVALLGAAALLWRQPSVSHGPSTLVVKSAEPSAVRAQAPLLEPQSPSLDDHASAGEELASENAGAIAAQAPRERDPSPAASGASAPFEKASPKASRSAAREASSPNSLALEARLLSRARRNLETAPERALALSDLHLRRYPQGVLSEEREVIAIQALRRSGREGAATQRQSRFLAKYPQSPHARSLTHGARP